MFKQKGKPLGLGKGYAVSTRVLAHVWLSAAVPEYNDASQPVLSVFWNNLKQKQL